MNEKCEVKKNKKSDEGKLKKSFVHSWPIKCLIKMEPID